MNLSNLSKQSMNERRVVESRGRREHRPISVQILYFHGDFGKNLQIIGWRPLRHLAPPNPGNPESATDNISQKNCGS